MNILAEILAHKRDEIAAARHSKDLECLRDTPKYSRTGVSLRAALDSAMPAIIAEVKRASPSKGIIRRDTDSVAIAGQYARNGAAGISVLTDSTYFGGSVASLESIREVTELPLLRKDFIIDSYQLHEAKAAGADAVLLIVAALAPSHLYDLAAEAHSLGLETLVEVHSVHELEILDYTSIDLLGINNRDLTTFAVDLNVSVMVRQYVPRNVLCVSESGIRSGNDIMRLMSEGIDAFLIGEYLMRNEHPGDALGELIATVRLLQQQ